MTIDDPKSVNARDPENGRDNERSKKSDSHGLPNESTTRRVRFEEIAACGSEVWIRHGGQLYRLQRTRRGKLILTK